MVTLYSLSLISDTAARYVGSTTTNVHTRLRQHKSAATRGVKSPVYQWMREVGIDNVTARIIATYESWDLACEAEQRSIDELPDLLNVRCRDGRRKSPGYERSAEIRAKISNSVKSLDPHVKSRMAEQRKARSLEAIRKLREDVANGTYYQNP